jgi:iron(III) transport system substrate-binding protein
VGHAAARKRVFAFLSALALMSADRVHTAPPPVPVTAELVEAATKERKVVFYTSIEAEVAQKLGKAFGATYPGITVQVERTGCERIFRRGEQEYASHIHSIDAFEANDVTHLLACKQQGWLAPYVPTDVARWPASARDADGLYAASRATLSVICAAPERSAAVRRVFLFVRRSLSQIKLLIADPGEQEKAIEEIKQRCRHYFGT